MSDGKSDIRDRLVEALGPEEFDEMVKRLRGETGGLLDDGAILALISDERGMTEPAVSTLAELSPDRPVFTRARIDAVDPVREFQGRERSGKLQKLRISDRTGTGVLTLWDEETGLVEQLGLKPGVRVRILGASLRSSRYGEEIHVGKTGFIVLEEEPQDDGPSEKRDIGELPKASGRVDVRGVVLSVNTSGRGRQKTTAIRLFDGTGECDIFVLHEATALPPGLGAGMEMELAGVNLESRDGRPVLRCDRRSSIRIV